MPPPTTRGSPPAVVINRRRHCHPLPTAAHCRRCQRLRLSTTVNTKTRIVSPLTGCCCRRHRDNNWVCPDRSPPPSLPPPLTFLVVARWHRIRGYFLLIMMPFQPVEDAAQMHQQSGISRAVEVSRDTQFLAHPSAGGARGYDIHTHEMMLKLRKSGNPVPRTMICSIQRWARRIVPHRMTGNKPSVGLTGKY